jgi:peptidoglycan hydrolase-like protein with peptidoglycan-binding domain
MTRTGIGRASLAAILLFTVTAAAAGPVFAEAGGGLNIFGSGKKKERSSNEPVTNISGGKSLGQAVTKTEVFADRTIRPMVSAGSDRALGDAIARYEIIVSRGGWGELGSKTLSKGDDGPAVVDLKKRLIAEGYLGEDSLGGETGVWYTAAVERAVSRYQANHGLAVSGNLDRATIQSMNVPATKRLASLRVNQPRMTEYVKDLGPRYIIVNVPALQLEAVEANRVFSRHNIIAGKPERPTPVTLTQVSDINFNPYWHVPVSIVERDLLPRIRTSGMKVFKEMRMRIFDGSYTGPEVDPKTVNWKYTSADRYHFRQDPGAANSMAAVKINFPSPFGIYLHDTPSRELFSASARYQSSGCVRVERIPVLVNWILNGQDSWSPEKIQQVADTEERLDVKVAAPPQIRVVYLTAWATEDGNVNFRPDIYEMDNTSFVVGQPLPAGEFSDEGQRFTLKAQAYKVQEVLDEENSFFFFGSRSSGGKKGKAATIFDGWDNDDRATVKRKKGKAATIFDGWTDDDADAGTAKKSRKKKLLTREDDGLETNFNRPVTKKKTAATKTKKKVTTKAAEKKKKKDKKGVDKVEASAAGKIKAKPAAAKTETAAKPVKKKKKVEEATATAEPVFGQQ